MAARGTAPVAAPAATRAAASVDRLDRILFYVLLAILCARPLISESYERLELSFLSALPTAGGPTPVTTAWLDTLTLAASGLALARRGRWRSYWPAAAGVVLLFAAVCLSSLDAGDRLLARSAGGSLWIGVVGGFALASLVRTRWMWQVLLAAWLATCGTTAVKCVRQTLVEFPELRQTWEREYLPQLLKQGYAADDPMLVNYGRRMRSQEAYGYLAHPNVTGSGLMLGLVTLAGLLLGRVAERADKRLTLVGAVGLLLMAVALWFTGSKGALGAAVIGLGGLVVLAWAARRLVRHARLGLGLLLAGYLAVIGATAAYGTWQGTLPHPSLAFRWYYWTAAMRVWQDVPLTGVGRGGFGPAYMRYKQPESTEEVRDPHNYLVSLLVELGPLGLAGGLLVVSCTVLAGLRRCGENSASPIPEVALTSSSTAGAIPPDPPESFPYLLRRAVPVALGVCGVHAVFSGTPLQQPAVAVLWIADVVVIWLVALLLALGLLAGLGRTPRGGLWLTAGLTAAFLGALVHNLMDFAAMTAGGLAMLAALGAAVCGVRRDPAHDAAAATMRRRGDALPVAIAALLVVAQIGLVAVPVGGREARAASLQTLQQIAQRTGEWHDVAAHALEALRRGADATESRSALRAVILLSLSNGLSVEERRAVLEEAERLALAQLAARPSRDTGDYLALGRLQQELARAYLQSGEAQQAETADTRSAASYDRAAELYPTNPRTQIAAGDVWHGLWKLTGHADAARQARLHYAAALRIDDVRLPEEVQRLRAEERGPVEARLRELP